MEKNLSYKEKCLLGIKQGMVLVLYSFIGLIIFFVLFFVAIELAKLLNGIFEINSIQWLSFIGSVVAGVFGVVGGIIAAKLQIFLDNDLKATKLKKYILNILLQEVKINNQELINWYSSKKSEYTLDKTFKITDWDKIKGELYIIDSDNNYKKLVDNLYELYGWLERINQLIDMKIDVESHTKDNILRKIKECLINTQNEYNKLKEG